MPSTVCGNDAEHRIGLIKNHDEVRLLHDLHRVGPHRRSGDAGRNACCGWAERGLFWSEPEMLRARFGQGLIDWNDREYDNVNTGKIGVIAHSRNRLIFDV